MPLTSSEERRLLDTSLDSTYLALFTADPTEAGTLTSEVTGGSYARQAATFDAASTDGSGDTTKAQTGTPLDFATATADWGTVTHFGYVTAATGGTLRWSAPLASPRTIGTGDRFTLTTAVAGLG